MCHGHEHRKGSGIVAGNPECVGAGVLVGDVQGWLVYAACVSVLSGGGDTCQPLQL